MKESQNCQATVGRVGTDAPHLEIGHVEPIMVKAGGPRKNDVGDDRSIAPDHAEKESARLAWECVRDGTRDLGRSAADDPNS
ncbi:MAG TPA: hypothetical protein VIE36_00980 [Methylomirabilota bacterium]